jgi:retron-type reverse transcriptase
MIDTDKNLYSKIYDFDHLMCAWISAKKGKTKRRYIKRFRKNLEKNLTKLQEELKNQTYKHNNLKTFPLRDPKTRKISKSVFKDRVVHHTVCKIIIPLFQKSFIYDCHANIIGRGTLKAIERFDKFNAA